MRSFSHNYDTEVNTSELYYNCCLVNVMGFWDSFSGALLASTLSGKREKVSQGMVVSKKTGKQYCHDFYSNNNNNNSVMLATVAASSLP